MKLKVKVEEKDLEIAKKKAIELFRKVYSFPYMECEVTKIDETNITFCFIY